MRFSCENCQAKYQVADEKVAGKTIRMKCRKCGHSIEVKPMAGAGEHAAGDLGATEQHPIAPPPETRLGGGLAAQSIAGANFPEPEHGMASRGAFDSQPGFDRAPESLRLALGATEASELPAHFWYVAIGGAPVGPIALAEVVAKAREGAIHDRSLAWREGLPEWQPIANLPELVEAIGPALQHAPPPRSVSGVSAAPVPPAARAPSPPPPAPVAAPAPQRPPPPARKEPAPHTATLAATPISNELRAILDSSPDLGAPPVAEAAPRKHAEPSTAPSPREERLSSPPPSVAIARPATSKAPAVLAGAVAGLVVGFAAGRFTAPSVAAVAPPPQGSVQTAPIAVDDKSDDVPLPPNEPAKPEPAPQAPAPRAAAAPAPRPAAPPPAPAPAAPASRPVTAAAPPPPPMPSFGGGGASLTEGQIAAVLSQRKIQLRRACWERIENHEAAVKVQATVNIDGSGRVSSVDATGTDPAVTGCIRQQIKEWQFPATGAPTTATLPFSFISQ